MDEINDDIGLLMRVMKALEWIVIFLWRVVFTCIIIITVLVMVYWIAYLVYEPSVFYIRLVRDLL
jgi:hypothetical protein